MLLRQLQETLGQIYDIPLEHDIDEFLVTDRQTPGLPNLPADALCTEEELLIRQDDDAVRVSLYLSQRVLDRLGDRDPLRKLDAGNLADYWTVLEGVSHFQYLAWNAVRDRPVSIHELEVQAEVDKYAATLFLIGTQQSGRFPVRLHYWLFDRARTDSAISGPRQKLYASANRYAARFCRALETRYLRRGKLRCEALLRELRHFYRLSHAPKIRFIETGHGVA